jgi:hypothetical protein
MYCAPRLCSAPRAASGSSAAAPYAPFPTNKLSHPPTHSQLSPESVQVATTTKENGPACHACIVCRRGHQELIQRCKELRTVLPLRI